MLNAEEHRRLIGNDIAVIIYVEKGATFSPKFLLELGTVQQVYVVVRPEENNKLWRHVLPTPLQILLFSLATFSNINIKDIPLVPPDHPVDLPTLKQYVLTKGMIDSFGTCSSPKFTMASP